MAPPVWAWLLIVFAVALASAALLAVIADHLGHRLGVVDLPRVGEVQRRPMPRTGGYAVLAAFWLAIGLSFMLQPAELERLPADSIRLFGVFLGTLALLPLAILDDRRRLGPWPQLVGQIVAA